MTMRQTAAAAAALLMPVMGATSASAQPGAVLSHTRITDGAGGFPGSLDQDDFFGHDVAALGDLDGDGVTDLAVGALLDDDGGADRGAVWILFMNGDGTVKTSQKISSTNGVFGGILVDGDEFGASVAGLGDLDGDGVVDLAVGANGNFINSGAVWVLFLKPDGTVKSHRKIATGLSGFAGQLDAYDNMGYALENIGDLDDDGVLDLAAGAVGDDDGGSSRGAVWVLFMNTDGTVKGHQKISDTKGGFTGALDNSDFLGFSVSRVADLNGDGNDELAVGAPFDDDGGSGRGAVWLLFLKDDGGVQSHQKISDTQGGFTGTMGTSESFGLSSASPGDVDGDGVVDLAVGATGDGDGGLFHGAVWMLFLNPDGTVKGFQKISDTQGGFTGVIADIDEFGRALTPVGDLNGDGKLDLVTSSLRGDAATGPDRGTIWVLFLDGVAAPDPWTDLGSGLAGAGGVPVLSGSGPLTAGSTATLTLTNALPGSTAALVIGGATSNLPLFGGTLVPTPSIIFYGLPLGGSGELVLSNPWPAGVPSGLSTTYQYWVMDPGGPQGYAASNGLRGTTP